MPITIDKPSKYFNTVLYTGTETTTNVTGVGFNPDWVWIKSRSDAYNHNVWDRVRGAGQRLITNATDAEETATSDMSAFVTDGFTVGGGWITNKSGRNYVAWNWLGGGTGVSNTAGTISSTVSANTTSGFSIVSYTGAGGASTVGHGLGVAPKLIIIKSRSNSTNWILGHNSLGWNKYIALNTTDAVETNNYFNDTAPTSSVFSIFSSVNVNGSGYTYVAYCFAEVKGFSKFGSFIGNGSATDGAFVYTGFKPAFVMIKSSSAGGDGYNWGMWDNKRIGYNVDNNNFRANQTNAEGTDDVIDLLSNGFKIRTDSGGFGGGSGTTYIYMCFAESPFTSSKGIPVTAR